MGQNMPLIKTDTLDSHMKPGIPWSLGDRSLLLDVELTCTECGLYVCLWPSPQTPRSHSHNRRSSANPKTKTGDRSRPHDMRML